jgi:Recombination endonuclease VII
MTDHLWDELPVGFLKKSAQGWLRLDRDVREVDVKLARAQKFKCAFCSQTTGLIIEHDHWPQRGSGEKLTIYNVRGLACHGCNWHLGMFEADQRGDCRGWDDAYIRISERNFEPYSYAYECRVFELLDKELEERLGSSNYWKRRLFLQRFDDWYDWGRRHYPWPSHFSEIKERRQRMIRTPEQFWNGLAAIARFVIEQQRKDPHYELPEQFLKLLVRVKPILDDAWPLIEERYQAIQAEPPTPGRPTDSEPIRVAQPLICGALPPRP